jgi:hypothetical protein
VQETSRVEDSFESAAPGHNKESGSWETPRKMDLFLENHVSLYFD